MFHLRFGLSDHLKALLDFVFGSRRRVKKVRIFRAWFSQKLGWRLCYGISASSLMEQDKRYLMLPRGVLHMSALGRFGRFTLFHLSSHLPNTCRVLVCCCWCLGFGCGCCFVVFLFLVLQVFWNPEFSAHIRPR